MFSEMSSIVKAIAYNNERQPRGLGDQVKLAQLFNGSAGKNGGKCHTFDFVQTK